MADITVRTIGYICPHCRQSVITDRSPFQLTASASCEIPCPCGKSSLKIEYLLDRFRITSPASRVGEVHTVTCPAEAFLSRKALAFFPVTPQAWTVAMWGRRERFTLPWPAWSRRRIN